jgi:competence protein CoiA
MQFALVGGERVEAQRGLRGACPACGAEVHARVGSVRVRHWAHMGCAPCSEPETLWHRSWKSLFPAEWRERDQVSEHGVAHRADIETNSGTVIEFQYSKLTAADQTARENFYRPLVWIVNGWRLKRPRQTLPAEWEERPPVMEDTEVRKVFNNATCSSMTRSWLGSPATVFFDFCDKDDPAAANEDRKIWWIYPKAFGKWLYVAPVLVSEFVEHYSDSALGETRLARIEGFERVVEELCSSGDGKPTLREFLGIDRDPAHWPPR